MAIKFPEKPGPEYYWEVKRTDQRDPNQYSYSYTSQRVDPDKKITISLKKDCLVTTKGFLGRQKQEYQRKTEWHMTLYLEKKYYEYKIDELASLISKKVADNYGKFIRKHDIEKAIFGKFN